MESSFGNTSFFVEAVLGGLLAHRSRSRVFVTEVPRHGADWRPETTVAFNQHRPIEQMAARHLVDAKPVTAALLAEAGLPVPDGRAFAPSDLPEARAFALALGWPVAVKPAGGFGGGGVTVGIADESSFEAAIQDAFTKGGAVLVQRHHEGILYRILASRDRVYAAYYNVLAHVVGDGASTVEQLVALKNQLRAANPHLGTRNRRIKLNEVASALLRDQGLAEDAVPEPGRSVVLARVANPHAGSETIDVTDDLHPSIVDLARRSVAAIPGLLSSGIDVLLPAGHRTDIAMQNAVILEHNWNHALGGHLSPWEGTPRNVVRMLLDDAARRVGIALETALESSDVLLLSAGPSDPKQISQVCQELREELGVRVMTDGQFGDGVLRVQGPRHDIAQSLERLGRAIPELLAARADRVDPARTLEIPGLGATRLPSGLTPCPWALIPTASGRPDRRPTSLRVRVSGDVVGVGFRRQVARSARRNNVAGWVRNTHDDHVEMLLSGGRADVLEVLAVVYDGPRTAQVRRVTVRRSGTIAEGAFRVRRTTIPKPVAQATRAKTEMTRESVTAAASEPSDRGGSSKPSGGPRWRMRRSSAREP